MEEGNGRPQHHRASPARIPARLRAVRRSRLANGRPSIGPMAMISSGTDSTALTQKRLREIDQFRVRALRRRSVRPSAPAPCRRSGRSRACRGRFRDASGRCIACLSASPRGAGRPPRYFCRLRLEFRLAAGRAEIEALALVPQEVLRGGAVDAHAADRIGRRRGSSPARRRTSRGSARCRNGWSWPPCSAVGLPAAGSTVMPQTGSRTTASTADGAVFAEQQPPCA